MRKVISSKNLRDRPPLAFLLALFCFIDRFHLHEAWYGGIWTVYWILVALSIGGWVYDLHMSEEADIFGEKN